MQTATSFLACFVALFVPTATAQTPHTNSPESKTYYVDCSQAMGVAMHNQRGGVIENNLIEFNGSHVQLDHGVYADGEDLVVRGNVVRHNANFGLHLYPAIKNSCIENNLVHGWTYFRYSVGGTLPDLWSLPRGAGSPSSPWYLVGGDDPTSGGRRVPRIEPDYADPIYLAKHGAFLRAPGERYDGHPDIEFLDIGSYGIWGEWHAKNPAPVAVRKQIVDLYLRAFRKTPLVFMSDDAELLNYALAYGTGFRRDGVGSPWHDQNWIGSRKYAGVAGMADTWKRAPVVFEWYGNYDYLQSRKWSVDAAVNFMLSNHVTLINDNISALPPEARPQLEKLARLAGARFVLRELTHPRSVSRGAGLDLEMKWANVGVGKLHRPYVLRLFLLDAAQRAASSTDTKADVRDWLPGEHELISTLQVPATLEPGGYPLALAMINPADPSRPFRLAIDATENDGRYVISTVRIE